MRTRPAWLTYAGRIKVKLDQLPRTEKSHERRERIVFQSYHEAKERFRYPGTLGDWQFILEETGSAQRT